MEWNNLNLLAIHNNNTHFLRVDGGNLHVIHNGNM